MDGTGACSWREPISGPTRSPRAVVSLALGRLPSDKDRLVEFSAHRNELGRVHHFVDADSRHSAGFLANSRLSQSHRSWSHVVRRSALS